MRSRTRCLADRLSRAGGQSISSSTQVPISGEMQIFPWGPSLGNAKFPCAQVAPARAARGVVPEGQLGRFDHRTDISRLTPTPPPRS